MAIEYFLRFGNGNPQTTTGLLPTLIVFNSFSGVAITPPGITESIVGSGLYKFEYSPSFSIAFIAYGNTTGLDSTLAYVSGAIDPADRVMEALGATMIAQGATLVAIGNTAITQSTNNGTTLVGIGNTAITQVNNIGTTLIAVGNTSAATGVTLIAQGATVVGIGNTLTALGGTFAAGFSALDAKIGSTSSLFGDASTDPGTLFGYMKRVRENLEGDATFNKATGVWTLTDRAGLTTLATKTLTNGITIVTKA